MSNSLNFREHMGIAVDGGGVRGAIVAQGIIGLEQQLGVSRLIDLPRVKVIAGTSTGSLIAVGLAVGLSGRDLLDLYRNLGKPIFARAGPFCPFGVTIPLISRYLPFPIQLVRLLRKLGTLGDFFLYPLLPARYSFDPLRKVLRDYLRRLSLPEDLTLGGLGQHLAAQGHDTTVIITATEVETRRTHFFKTNAFERYPHFGLVEAMLASSCIPTYFEPITLTRLDGQQARLVDGGVGSFGNPAHVVAWELCDPLNPDTNRRYNPDQTSVLSFGTGTVSRQTYRNTYGDPYRWWALQWVQRAVDVFFDMALRDQSAKVIHSYPGIDLRRWQVALGKPVNPDDFGAIEGVLQRKGEELQRLIRENRHALNPDPALRHDPECLWNAVQNHYPPESPC